jgi:hypothetical protein
MIYWDPNSQLSEYTELFGKQNVHKILLFRRQQVAETRNLERSDTDEEDEYINFGIRLI